MAQSRELEILLTLKDQASRELNAFSGKLEGLKPTFTKMAAIGTAAFATISGVAGSALKEFADSEQQATKKAHPNPFPQKTLRTNKKYPAYLDLT